MADYLIYLSGPKEKRERERERERLMIYPMLWFGLKYDIKIMINISTNQSI